MEDLLDLALAVDARGNSEAVRDGEHQGAPLGGDEDQVPILYDGIESKKTFSNTQVAW